MFVCSQIITIMIYFMQSVLYFLTILTAVFLTVLLHMYDILATISFPMSNTCLEISDNGQNMWEEYHTIVYYCM